MKRLAVITVLLIVVIVLLIAEFCSRLDERRNRLVDDIRLWDEIAERREKEREARGACGWMEQSVMEMNLDSVQDDHDHGVTREEAFEWLTFQPYYIGDNPVPDEDLKACARQLVDQVYGKAGE